jgi:predicted CXXCH cytochrome family protein
MKKYFNKNKLIMALAVSAACALPLSAMAKVSGPCADCHTMHNSQDGSAMASTGAFGAAIVADNTANGALLRYGCIGCHTGDNAGGSVPFVLASAAPTYGTNTLAGGNFYWVNNGTDAAGHNVVGLPAVNTEDTLSVTPGAGAALNVPLPNALTCAGTTGCHGDRTVGDEFGSVAGGHHGSGGTVLAADTTKTYTSGHATDMSDAFRMLGGIKGIEDADWEYTADGAKTTADHNLYYGVARTDEADAAAGTISSLCAQCHGEFHNGAGNVSASTFGSPWVRHPTDFDMSALATTSEYAGYAAYSMEAPVASGTISAATDLTAIDHIGGAGAANGNAIVTCVSCHRAHGSPYADLLRWDYGTEDAHSGDVNTGCFNCHTTKDNV